jgi:hypothetical protein
MPIGIDYAKLDRPRAALPVVEDLIASNDLPGYLAHAAAVLAIRLCDSSGMLAAFVD